MSGMKTKALDQSLKYIDSWLQFRYGQEEIPGYCVAIAHKGKVIFNKVYGFADIESKTKLTTSHIFRIASHSKTFTATALMQLQEAGKLRIDDYAVDYLPWLKEHKDKRWQKVTLRQLMSHGAGVIRDGLNSDYWQLERAFPDKDELRLEILESNLVLDSNTKLKYSNYGYSLLGMVVESASGRGYNDYVIEHIVQVLDLKSTGPEYTPSIDDKLVTGYSRREADKVRLPIAQIDTHAMAPATGFYATAKDLCTYFSAQMLGSGILLSDESKKEMQRVHYHAYTPDERGHIDYGLGMEVEFVGRRKTFGHGGGFPGHVTKSMFDPKDELVVTVLTNCIGGPAVTITKSIYGIIDYYQKNTPANRSKHNLQRLEGRYFSIFGIIDIVVTGDKVVTTSPSTWWPLMQPEELERIDDTTFKVLETNSFNSEGELVRFNIQKGHVETVNHSGTTMWPEAAWTKKQKSRKVIKLP